MKSKQLFNKCSEVKVFRDPIHSYIHVEYQIIYDLINTPSFQRLRRIKQLGATYIVYPTGEHTRFSHSLGVYEIARRIISENAYVADALKEEEKLYIMIAALVHDIGHGPYSHVFEKITNISHEYISESLINNESDIHNILESYQSGLSKIVSSIINHSYPKKLCWQIISSQLDADRMDYLLRDAYFTGTKYGEFDLERILRTLRVHNDCLVVKESGIYAIEDYLMARFHMFWQVYYHINIRVFEHMLASLTKRIADIKKCSDDEFDYLDKLINPNHIDLNLYLEFDDASMIQLFKKLSHHQDPIISDLATRLLNRDLFKTYLNSEENIQYLKTALIDEGLDLDYYLILETVGHSATSPYNSNGKQKINIMMKNGEILEFSKASAIMKSLSKTNETHSSLIFAPRIKNV